MFPSQRGNFFPNLPSHVNLNDNKSYKTGTGLSSSTNRLKSPPLSLGASAGSRARKLPVSLKLTRSIMNTTPNISINTLDTLLSKSHYPVSSGNRSTKFPPIHFTPETSISTEEKSDWNRTSYSSKLNPTIHTPRLIMSRIPSTWSNQQWSVNDPYFQFNLRRGINIDSISTNSKLVCGYDNICGKLSPKVEQERGLVKRLCEDALKTRRDAYAFYSNLYDEELSESKTQLSNFDPKDHKGRLCEFMLKLVIERDQLLHDRRAAYYHGAGKSVLDEGKPTKPRYIPLFCVGGRTFLGKPYDSISFPNSFAPLVDLCDPRDDPKGYRRFCTLVNMTGFNDSEIFFRITGNCLTVDGVRLKKDMLINRSSARVVSIYIDLPKGVYPEHLKIGRSSDGILVIQEPWTF